MGQAPVRPSLEGDSSLSPQLRRLAAQAMHVHLHGFFGESSAGMPVISILEKRTCPFEK